MASKPSPSAQHQRVETCCLDFFVIPGADAPLDQRHNPAKVIDSPFLGEESVVRVGQRTVVERRDGQPE